MDKVAEQVQQNFGRVPDGSAGQQILQSSIEF